MTYIMTYRCDLGGGQQIYLDNQEAQTNITTVSSNPGQQQQASSSFQTGVWTAAPQAFRTARGVVIKIQADKDYFIQIQSGSISVGDGIPSSADALPMQQVPAKVAFMQPMEPLKPMTPMPPMQMGNMSMNLNPMQMRMGNMEMQMGSSASSTQRFCRQCGIAVKPDDRFCASCGTRLN